MVEHPYAFAPSSRLWIAALVTLCVVGGCRTTPEAADPGRSHLGDAWYALRARQLALSETAARERDARLSTQQPPHAAWDTSLRREAQALWRDHCALCHGARGRRQDSAPLPEGQKAPRDWGSFGTKLAFRIGGDGLRATFYRRIAAGGDREGRANLMPAWGDTLAREQIWALVFLLEEF